MKDKFFQVREIMSQGSHRKTLVVSLPVAWMKKGGELNFTSIRYTRDLHVFTAEQAVRPEVESLKKDIWYELQKILAEGKITLHGDNNRVEVHPIEGLYIGRPESLKCPEDEYASSS